MKEFESELLRIQEELENTHLSKERVWEIRAETLTIAHKLDSANAVSSLSGTVKEVYRSVTKYPKRRVKKVVALLIDYVSEKNLPKEDAATFCGEI